MKNANSLLIGAMLSLAALMPLSATAQATGDAGKPAAMAAASMTDGEVRKIDKDAGKITIKHGDIKHLEMPGITSGEAPIILHITVIGNHEANSSKSNSAFGAHSSSRLSITSRISGR